MGIQIWSSLWKWIIFLFKIHLHSGLTRINPKTIRIWLKWEKECLNIATAREPIYIYQIGIKKLFCIFKPIIPLLSNRLRSRLVKPRPGMTRSSENGAQELHVFSRNWDHVYNGQMGIQIWFHLWKWRICLFKNHVHSELTRINPKMIRIWSKWAKQCLNVVIAREPPVSLKWVSKTYFIFLNPQFQLF